MHHIEKKKTIFEKIKFFYFTWKQLRLSKKVKKKVQTSSKVLQNEKQSTLTFFLN